MSKGYNLASLGIMEAGSVIGPGQVALANEGAFGKSFFSQPMTNYAIGWKTEDKKLENLLEFIAPGVRTARRFEYKKANNADEFALIADGSDVRALFGEFKMVQTIGDIVNAKTVSKGLTTVIEKDNEQPHDVKDKIKWLKKLLIKAEIYRAMTLLAAAATNTAKTWNKDARPDMDLMAAIDAFGDKVGVDANRILMGTSAWMKRIGAYQAGARSNFVPPATLKDLADFLNVDEIFKSSQRYTSGDDRAKLVAANKVFIFAGERGASLDDFSTIKRFWSPDEGGGEYAVFIDDQTSAKLKKVTVCHTSQIATTCATGVQSLTIS